MFVVTRATPLPLVCPRGLYVQATYVVGSIHLEMSIFHQESAQRSFRCGAGSVNLQITRGHYRSLAQWIKSQRSAV